MKKIVTVFAFLLVFSPMVGAAELTAPQEQVEEVDPGITPDSPMYGLDVALDNVRYALSNNKEETGLEIAKERLAENKAMTQEGKTEAAEEAMQQAERVHERVRQRVREKGGNMPSLDEVGNDIEIPNRGGSEGNDTEKGPFR